MSAIYSFSDCLKRMKVARTAAAVEIEMLNIFDTSKRLHKKDPFLFFDTQRNAFDDENKAVREALTLQDRCE
jgi:hypothetical protein